MWDLEEDKIFFFQQQSKQGAQPDPPLLSALKPWCFCEHHKSKGQFARVHGEGFACAVRTVMENTPETGSSELKSLWGSPTEGEVFREREQLFLWALLETYSQVFWLDSPLKASFTSCRSASCCPLLPVGHKKKRCEEQESGIVSYSFSTNSSTEQWPCLPCTERLCLLLGASWLAPGLGAAQGLQPPALWQGSRGPDPDLPMGEIGGWTPGVTRELLVGPPWGWGKAPGQGAHVERCNTTLLEGRASFVIIIPILWLCSLLYR